MAASRWGGCQESEVGCVRIEETALSWAAVTGGEVEGLACGVFFTNLTHRDCIEEMGQDGGAEVGAHMSLGRGNPVSCYWLKHVPLQLLESSACSGWGIKTWLSHRIRCLDVSHLRVSGSGLLLSSKAEAPSRFMFGILSMSVSWPSACHLTGPRWLLKIQAWVTLRTTAFAARRSGKRQSRWALANYRSGSKTVSEVSLQASLVSLARLCPIPVLLVLWFQRLTKSHHWDWGRDVCHWCTSFCPSWKKTKSASS